MFFYVAYKHHNILLSYITTSCFPPFQDACAAIEIDITEEDEANEAETVESVDHEQYEDESVQAEFPVQGMIYHIFLTKTLQ